MAKSNNLTDFLTDVADAIREKKGTTEKINPQDFSEEIRSIEGGGGITPCEFKDVNFYDYEGTILYSYTWDEFVEKNEMPPLPTHHKGLTCQEWNYTLDEVLEQGGRCDVGAIYIPEDGNTHIFIETISDNFKIDLFLRNTKSTIVYWGDGSVENVEDFNGSISKSHIYTNKGEYEIIIESESFELGKNTNYSCVMPKQSITKVFCGSNLFRLWEYSLKYCRNLTGIVLNEGVKMPSSIFYGATTLKHINIPKDVYLDYLSLASSSIQSISIPNNGGFDGQTFDSCSTLKYIHIPNNVKIQYRSLQIFKSSLKKSSVGILNTTYTSIGNLIIKDKSIVSGINDNIPEGIESIDLRAFLWSPIRSVKMPSSLLNINDAAFQECLTLETLTMGENVTTIKTNAFSNCISISNVIKMPKNVLNIPSNCFYNCSNIPAYDFRNHESIPTLTSTNAFNGCLSTMKIIVPDALYDQWITATNWATYASRIVKASEFVEPTNE